MESGVSACGGGCVGERVYVGWLGVLYAGFLEVVFRGGGEVRACGRWEGEVCAIYVLDGTV
jgi:hypothetical protein